MSKPSTAIAQSNNVIDLREFITVRDRTARTTSLKVAEAFGRTHKNVLQAIHHLDCSEDFSSANFSAHAREVVVGGGAKRKSPMYEMTKDGFVFLVMGFTGAKAAAIKEAYIAAFNWMFDQLEQKGQGIWDTTIGTDGAHVLGELVTKKVKHLPKHLQNSVRMTLWSRLHTRFNVPRAELIPARQMDSAANFLAAYVYEGSVEDKRTASNTGTVDDAGQGRQIHEAAMELGAKVARDAYDFMLKDHAMPYTDRYLVSTDRNGKPYVSKVPNDSFVFSLQRLASGLVDGSVNASDDELKALATNAAAEMKRRLNWLREKSGMSALA